MADKLDWLNKHLVLLRYITLDEVVTRENYKIRPDLESLFTGITNTEGMVFKLSKSGDFKSACELMAYICHRRAGVWWAYRCVTALQEELQENPAADRDIADIGASFETTVPDFAKIELPVLDPGVKANLDDALKESLANHEIIRAQAIAADPEMMDLVESAVETAFQEFKQVHGIHPKDLLIKLGKKLAENPHEVDPNSPIFKAADELKVQLQALQKETVDTIKSVLPPKAPEHEKKVRDNALAAVFRWVAAPDGENSQKCLDIGNECPDTPAGLLALSSFWAFGNLMPMGEQVIPTPAGLAANGLSQVLLMCALHKGGTRKLKERYELYFNLGVAVLSGADNWEESLTAGKAPHEAPPAGGMGAETPGPAPHNANNGDAVYKRWKAPPPQ
jgi:hypothetical protein